MKRWIFMAVLAFATTVSASAQEVFKEILRMSKEVANNKSKSLEIRKIATFKVDELNYMAQKTMEMMPDSSVIVLDYQALAMKEFVDLFTSKLTKASKKRDRQRVLQLFKEASINNPRFGDLDKDLVLSYYSNDNYLTQFSLDTDWEKALEYVRQQIRAGRL